MKKFLLVTGIALFLSACSFDEESKAKLEKAAEHAKQAAKEVGEVVSATTSEAHDKWSEMNADRIEETAKEDSSLPEHQADTDSLKKRLKAAKDAFFNEPEERIEQSKESGEQSSKEG